ncbi:MAG: amino acid ABC transporter substrate-binding protein [Gammaproteobacteria bacterium]|nr:amino acid ABC transporter substrate-binding protein [Gammaproteobacteria bacterium]MDH4254038.1 amino acid ABC transporter substrate-binding protein [Gammaproteobacteria bacterium]MDH5310337.1 amino acid ABC transporter substrate-binding protein [Gammaproteobacteria bacterium]
MPRAIASFVLIFLPALLAHAQDYASTLDRVAGTGEFRIGFVPDAPPMSFLDESGNPVGYSIDLCRHIASSVRDELGLEKIDISFLPLVSMEQRLEAVEQNLVDIECGATTVTLSRRERVDFTLLTFITGGSILSRNSRPIGGLEGIDGKRIAVIAGTTTEDALREFAQANDYRTEIRLIETHDEGMELLDTVEVDGYASDRAMLVGQVFRSPNSSNYTLTQRAFSFEPYSLMLNRGDTRFRLSADRALADLYRTARIRRIYHNWFGRYGETLSPILEAVYEFQAVGE